VRTSQRSPGQIDVSQDQGPLYDVTDNFYVVVSVEVDVAYLKFYESLTLCQRFKKLDLLSRS
jgi:hypothetical protein